MYLGNPLRQIYNRMTEENAAMWWGRTFKGGSRQIIRWGCDTVMEITDIGMCNVDITPNSDKRWMLDIEITGPGDTELYYTVNHRDWREAFNAIMESLEERP